jgi:antagonist of KipI
MSITVIRPGMLTTVQDLGRHGYQHLGVPVAGPMDWWSHQAANALAGNGPAEALLEVTLIGPELELGRNATAAVTGAQFELSVAGRAVPMNLPFAVEAGERLSFGHRLSGARAYLAFGGGIDVAPVLGSRATHAMGRLGGHEGRALRRGDVLALKPAPASGRVPDAPVVSPHLPIASPLTLRVIAGPDTAPEALWHTVFTVSPRSDRMGYALEGGSAGATGDYLSSPVAMGTLQVTPSGTCLLLMADRATSGGYARAACVITADLPRAGQLAPGDAVRFTPVSLADARRELDAMLAQLPVLDA